MLAFCPAVAPCWLSVTSTNEPGGGTAPAGFKKTFPVVTLVPEVSHCGMLSPVTVEKRVALTFTTVQSAGAVFAFVGWQTGSLNVTVTMFPAIATPVYVGAVRS